MLISMQKIKNKIWSFSNITVSYLKNRENLLKIFSVLFPIIIMAILTIPNLGNREMWVDEAHSAVLGKRVLEYGYYRVWDGNNFASYRGTDFMGNFVEMLLNWFSYYFTAFALVFSKTLFGIRIWFVVLGLMSALYFYHFVKEITQDKKVAILALWLYCLSVPVILYIKVAYYYAPSLLFINMACYYAIKIQKNNKLKYKILLAITMIFLFYTNYLFFAILSVSLIVYLLYSLKSLVVLSKQYYLSLIIVITFILPYLIAKIYYLQQFGSIYETVQPTRFITQLLGYLWQIQVYFIPFITFGIMTLIKYIIKLFNKKRQSPDNDNLLNTKKMKIPSFLILSFTIIFSNLFFISYFTWDYATRYLIVSIPFFYYITTKTCIAFSIEHFAPERKHKKQLQR